VKFLIDVCTGRSLTNWLTSKGYDVKEIRDEDNSIEDEQIINIASAEDRIIITVDKDFGELFVLYKSMNVV